MKPKEINLSNGVHVMSNSFLDDLSWPKTKKLKDLVEGSGISKASSPDEIRDELFEIMCTRQNYMDLPDSKVIQSTSYDRDDLEELGNIFIKSNRNWCTRSTVVVVVDKFGKIFYYYKNTENLKIVNDVVESNKEFVEFIVSKNNKVTSN